MLNYFIKKKKHDVVQIKIQDCFWSVLYLYIYNKLSKRNLLKEKSEFLLIHSNFYISIYI